MATIFDRMAKEIMQYEVTIRGKVERIHVLEEILYEKYGAAPVNDPHTVAYCLARLPAIQGFYAEILDERREALEAQEDNFKIWMSQRLDTVRTEDQAAQASLKSSLQKPLTISELETKVAVRFEKEWREWKEKISLIKRDTSRLGRILEQIHTTIFSLQSINKINAAMMGSHV
jgi:hypothetical protein